VFALKSGGYVLDCQADLLSDLNTRFVVPLLPESKAPTCTEHRAGMGECPSGLSSSVNREL
jgi:hypothetical protein